MTTVIAAGDIRFLRTQYAATFNDVAGIQRQIGTVPDGAGGRTPNWPTIASGLPCRLVWYPGRKGGTEVMAQNILEGVVYWHIALPLNTDVRSKDRITIGTRTFEVVAVSTPATWPLGTRAFCVEQT